MAIRQTSFLAKPGADRAPCAAKWLLSVAVCLLLVQGGRTQSLIPRVQRGSTELTQVGDTFYVVEGTPIKFSCFCIGDYTNVEMLHNGARMKFSASCTTLLHSIQNASLSDQGVYICRAQALNGTIIERPLGNLTVLNSRVFQAEPVQYGLLNTQTALNCSTTLNEFEYLVSVEWFRGEGHNKVPLTERPQFDSTAISDEGVYTCEISLVDIGISVQKMIDLKIIARPVIFHEEGQLQFVGNNRQEILVPFQSRFMDNTVVTWWKDGVPLTRFGADIQQAETAPPNSTTTLILNPARRNDSGEYKVSVENQFNVIPRELQHRELCLTVRIIVPPAKPVISVSEPFNTVSWSLPQSISEDERADHFTVSLNFTNGTVAQELAQTGDAREAELSVVPGMSYVLTVTAHNQDGSTVSDVWEFTTPPGAPSAPSVQVNRLSNSSIEIIVNLAYTGGSDITVLDVSFREVGTREWIETGIHDAHSMSDLTWKALVSDDRFVGIGVQFLVAVRNAHGHTSQHVELIEPLVFPGPPSILLVSRSSDSLTLQIQLSDIGAAPILRVKMNITHTFQSQLIESLEWNGRFSQGELLDSASVSTLEPNTNYTFTAVAVNFGGVGTLSMEFTFATGAVPSVFSQFLPLWILLGLVFLSGMIITLIILVFYYGVKKKGVRRDDHHTQGSLKQRKILKTESFIYKNSLQL